MKKWTYFLFALAFGFVALGVYSNVREQQAVDRTKLPSKVELSRGFQRWITNLKNKGLNVNADDFKLSEEVEIYNTKWMTVSAIDTQAEKDAFQQVLDAHRNIDKIIFSPSDREFIDFRNIERDGYLPNEVHFYGQKDDKAIDLRVADCSTRGNCYFDRAYFLSNDLFVFTEISRNINKRDLNAPACLPTTTCSYTFKLHLVDLINNSRLIYESKPFDAVLSDLIPKL